MALFSAFFSTKMLISMPFEDAYELMTHLMPEAYDPELKERLGLGLLSEDDVQAEAESYFEAFHGIVYFFAGGLQRNTTPIIFYINRLNRIAETLFISCWDIQKALVEYLLTVEMGLPETCLKIKAKKQAIEEMKSRLRLILVKNERVDLDHCDSQGVQIIDVADLVPDWVSKKVCGKKVSLRPFVPRIYWKCISKL